MAAPTNTTWINWSDGTRTCPEGTRTSFPYIACSSFHPKTSPPTRCSAGSGPALRTAPPAFQHLVIFGQHGISATLRALLAEFGLTLEQVPTLVMVEAPAVSTVHTMALAQGDEAGKVVEREPWQTVLSLVEGAVERGEKAVELASMDEVNSRTLGNGPLPEVVARVLARLS